MNNIITLILAATVVLVLVLIYADEIEDAIRNFVDFVMGRHP